MVPQAARRADDGHAPGRPGPRDRRHACDHGRRACDSLPRRVLRLLRREELGHEAVRRFSTFAPAVQILDDVREGHARVAVELRLRHREPVVGAGLVPRREEAAHAVHERAVDVEEGRRRGFDAPRADVALVRHARHNRLSIARASPVAMRYLSWKLCLRVLCCSRTSASAPVSAPVVPLATARPQSVCSGTLRSPSFAAALSRAPSSTSSKVG